MKKRRNPAALASLVCLALALASNLPAEDWPQWRGPNRDGKSAETDLLRSWPEGGPKLAWKAGGLGAGYGSVSIEGEQILVQGTVGKKSAVFCLNPANGSIVWQTPLGKMLKHNKGNGPRGTPTIEGDDVYALSEAGDLARLNRADGKVVWRRNILKDYKAKNIGWKLSESPLIHGEKLIVSPGGKNATMVALNKNTGKEIWGTRGMSTAAAYSSAIAASVGGTDVIMNFTSKAGVGVRADDGKVLWRYTRPANGTANCATPLFADNRVFYSSAYGTGCGQLRLSNEGGKITHEETYFNRNMMNHHGGMVLVDGYIYGVSDSIMACLDFKTGERMWRKRSVGKGSVTYADGHIYLLGENYKVGLIEANPKKYVEKGRFQIEDTGRPSWAYPVVCNGRLYIRNQHEVLCYDVSKPGA